MPQPRPTRSLRIESLEGRALLAITALEQYYVYRLNWARDNPVRYQNEQLLSVDLSYVTPQPPLAINTALFNSSEAKVNDMIANNYFAHLSPSGTNANKLVRDHGYALPATLPRAAGGSWVFNDSGNSVESLAAGQPNVNESMNGLIVDAGHNPPGHRIHMLGIDEPNSLYREIGIGYATGGFYGHYWALHIAARSLTQSYATGVVYNDLDSDGKMDFGEGLAGVTVTIASLGLTATTNAGGGWALAAPNGTYTVQASGGGFTGTSSVNATISGENVEVDFRSGIAGGQVAFVQVGGGPVDPAPTLTSVTRLDANPVVGASARFQVTFSESVTNVNAADFALATTGNVAGTISTVTGSGASYQVTVNNLTGAGTLGLGIAAGHNIQDATGNALAATAPTTNELYTLPAILTLTLPTSIAENGGPQAGIGTVTRTGSTTAAVTVTLQSSDTTEVRTPVSVNIAAGQSSANFFLSAQDDTLLDGSQTATITASATNYTSGTRTITVTDVETVGVFFANSVGREGGPGIAGMVRRNNTDTQSPLTVSLQSGNTSAATVPTTVTIPAGAAEASFVAATPNNATLTGSRVLAIDATASGYVGGVTNITVLDDEHIAVWHNAVKPGNVDLQGGVDAQDVLFVMYELGVRQYSNTEGLITALSANPQRKLDINADGYIDAQDVLYAMEAFVQEAQGEGESLSEESADATDSALLQLALDLELTRRRRN